MPLMLDPPHQQRTIKFHGTSREQLLILEKARFHPIHGQWLDLPASGPLYRAATAMTLASVVATQIGNLFAQRTESLSVFRMRWNSNRLVWIGIATELMLIVLLVYVPVFQHLFDTASFPLHNWLFLFAWAPILLLADEGRKALVRHRARRKVHGGCRVHA